MIVEEEEEEEEEQREETTKSEPGFIFGKWKLMEAAVAWMKDKRLKPPASSTFPPSPSPPSLHPRSRPSSPVADAVACLAFWFGFGLGDAEVVTFDPLGPEDGGPREQALVMVDSFGLEVRADDAVEASLTLRNGKLIVDNLTVMPSKSTT